MRLCKFATNSTDGDCINRMLYTKQYEELHRDAFVAIGHTRWATCGGKEDVNAHPHFDMEKTVFVVHNGTILNYRLLKMELLEKGVKFHSETDSELIAQLIALSFKSCKDPREAIVSTLERLDGTYGLVILFKALPERLYCIQHGSHLVIGQGDNEVFLASEARAFETYTQMRMELLDNELVEMGKDTQGNFTVLNSNEKMSFSAPKQKEKLGLKYLPFKENMTYLEREIFEQDEAVFNAIGKNSRIDTVEMTARLQGLQMNETSLRDIEHIYIYACGSSYYSALYAVHFFRMINDFSSVQVFDPADVSDYDLPKKKVQAGNAVGARRLHQPVRRDEGCAAGAGEVQEAWPPDDGDMQHGGFQARQGDRLRMLRTRGL